jgi:prepilin-type N-terminal cleavage/methylation domain-containing protein
MNRGPASQSGFSLLEMLVGLTLLALISVAVTQSVRTGLRMWQAAEANDTEAEWQQTEWLIERWLSRAISPSEFDIDSRVIFDPQPGGLTFVVDGQVGRKPAGYSRIGLVARDNPVCPGRADFILVWEDVTMASSFAPSTRDERLLFECADAVKFEYTAGALAETAVLPDGAITSPKELPRAVQIQLVAGGKLRTISARLIYAQ